LAEYDIERVRIGGRQVVIEPLMMIAGMEKKVINAFMEDISEALKSGNKKTITLYNSF